jgi:hypothetical protein
METERIALSQRERDRLKVLREIQQKHLTQIAGAQRLKISDRQVRRMLLRLRQRGDQRALFYEPAVHCQCTNLAGDRGRSQALGSKDRRDQHSAHLGQNLLLRPHIHLRHSCGRNIARPTSLDPPSVCFLLSREDPQSRLSWEIPGRSEMPLPQQKTILRRPSSGSGRLCAVLETDPPPAPP